MAMEGGLLDEDQQPKDAEDGFQVIENGGDMAMDTQQDDMDARPAQRERLTTPYMTKYERARILGTRALQIRFVLMLKQIFQSCSA